MGIRILHVKIATTEFEGRMNMTGSAADFQVWETVLHAFLNSFPYMVLALYAYRRHWRFNKGITLTLLFGAVAAQMVIVPLVLLSDKSDSPVFHIVISAIHIAFFFTAVKVNLGKLIFSVLVLTNLGTLVVVCARCLEGIFFPELIANKYHFTYQLFTILMQAAIIPAIYLFVFKDIDTPSSDAQERSGQNANASSYMWRYLWLVPAVFYLIWVNYSVSGERSVIENYMDPANALYLLAIDAGSILIYRTIIQMVKMYEKNTNLLAENHVLSIQRLQYDSLNERLENMRRTRHDLRHHAALLKQIRNSGDVSALDDLINTYTEENLLDQQLVFCENETVNVILALYSETAYKNNICLSVKADIPKDVFVDKKDLAVLFGNILENATDACKEVPEERFINITAAYTESSSGSNSLSLIVKNNYSTEPSKTESGIFHSTKHPGDGIGISSVKNIAEKYGGASTFSHEDGLFTASVILYG